MTKEIEMLKEILALHFTPMEKALIDSAIDLAYKTGQFDEINKSVSELKQDSMKPEDTMAEPQVELDEQGNEA